MAPALGPSHRFIVKGDIVNDLLKGIGNVVNPKRVFRELTDFKPGEFVLIAVMLLAQLVSFFVSKDFRGRLNWSDFRPMHRVQSHSRRPWATDQLSVGLHRLCHLADRCHHEPSRRRHLRSDLLRHHAVRRRMGVAAPA